MLMSWNKYIFAFDINGDLQHLSVILKNDL